MRKRSGGIVVVVACVALMLGAQTALGSVMFTVGSNNIPQSGGDIGTPTGSYWQLGTGWGTSLGQLDAVFALNSSLNAPNTLSFSLNPGQSHSWRFGAVDLKEWYIDSSETNNLGVTAWVYFTQPPGVGGVPSSTTGVAVTGWVFDSGKDLTINFNPVNVDFGNGGQFTLDLSDLCFKCNECLNVDACVTLCHEPTAVPEPATIAIWSLFAMGGWLGLRVSRRRPIGRQSWSAKARHAIRDIVARNAPR
jgi:hypothetical protein